MENKIFYVSLTTDSPIDFIISLKGNILRKLQEKYENRCYQDYYIEKILPESISTPVPRVMPTNTSGDCFMDIAFSAKVHKYNINDILVAKVFKINNSINASAEESYSPALCILKNHPTNSTIQINQHIPIIVSAVETYATTIAPIIDAQIFIILPIIKYKVIESKVNWNEFKPIIDKIKKIPVLKLTPKIFSTLGIETGDGESILNEEPSKNVGYCFTSNSKYKVIKKGEIPETSTNIIRECLRKQLGVMKMVHFYASNPKIWESHLNIWINLKIHRENKK